MNKRKTQKRPVLLNYCDELAFEKFLVHMIKLHLDNAIKDTVKWRDESQ